MGIAIGREGGNCGSEIGLVTSMVVFFGLMSA